MTFATMFPSYSGAAYTVLVALLLGALAYLAGTTREAWATRETAIGMLMLGLAVLLDGIFITGASTFGPTPVLAGEVFGFDCGRPIDDTACNFVDLSTGRGYLVDARLPQPVRFDTFWRGDKHVIAQISIWDSKIHWMRTDNTSPPTIVGQPARIDFWAVGEVVFSLCLFYLAFFIRKEAKRLGITHECDPLVLLRKTLVNTALGS
jgi:hypothetical protein